MIEEISLKILDKLYYRLYSQTTIYFAHHYFQCLFFLAEKEIIYKHFLKINFKMITNVNEDVQRHSVHTLVFRSLKRTHDMFVSNQGLLPDIDEKL